METDGETWLNLAEAARYCGMGEKQFRQWRQAGFIRTVSSSPAGGKQMVFPSELDRFKAALKDGTLEKVGDDRQ